MRHLLILCAIILFAAPGQAIRAPGLDHAGATRVLEQLEARVVACVHEERPERPASVRVRVSWREQRRTGHATVQVRSPVASACIEAATRSAFGGYLRQRFFGQPQVVTRTYRVPARRAVEPTPSVSVESLRRTLARNRRSLARCVRSTDPSFAGTVTLVATVSSSGETSLRSVQGVDNPRARTCMSNIIARQEIPRPPEHAVDVDLQIPIHPRD